MNPQIKSTKVLFSEDVDEEQAESVDSGCVPDSFSDLPHTQLKRVPQTILEEYKYMVGLLQNYGLFSPPKKTSIIHDTTKTADHIGDGSTESSKNVLPLSDATANSSNSPSNPLDSIDAIYSSFKSREEKLKLLQKMLADARKGKFNRKLSRKKMMVLHKKLKKKIAALFRQHKKVEKNLQNSSLSLSKVNNKDVKPAIKIDRPGGKLVFNKFDFRIAEEDKRWSENRHKNLHSTLSKVLQEKEQVKKLASEGKVEPASQKVLQKGWDNAMKKAEGAKIKDDPALLQKALKKKKHHKQKSQRDWESRKNSQQERMETKKQQRDNNINLRKQRKNENKAKRLMKKRSRNVPGF